MDQESGQRMPCTLRRMCVGTTAHQPNLEALRFGVFSMMFHLSLRPFERRAANQGETQVI